MADPKNAWRSIRRRPRLALFSAALVVVIVAGAAWAGLTPNVAAPGPVAAISSQTPQPSSTLTPSPTPTPRPSIMATPAPMPVPSPATEALVGSDGRLTILVLGSDYRRGHAGNRTDTIMIVSVDPTSGAVAAASIPRDTVKFPLPEGSTYKAKVNGLYQSYVASVGVAKAGAAMKRTVGRALGVEIDNYVVIGFEGLKRMIDAVGGVDVVLDKAVVDPEYWLAPGKHGVSFPAGRNHLSGARALIFARTRKGDNDFERARRQQQLMAAAVDAVTKRGLGQVPKLLKIAAIYVQTDIPIAAAPRIFAIVESANTARAAGIVFGPTKWAQGAGGTSFSLRLREVRNWTATWMAPIAPAAPAFAEPAPSSKPGL